MDRQGKEAYTEQIVNILRQIEVLNAIRSRLSPRTP